MAVRKREVSGRDGVKFARCNGPDAPHRALLIDWDKDFLPEVRASLEPYIMRHAGILPAWCTQLIVTYDDREVGNAVIKTTSMCDYRWARFEVYPCWLTLDDEEKAEIVIHEMCHVLVAPLVDAADDGCKIIEKENEVAAGLLSDLIRRRMEQSVTDIAQVITANLPTPGKKR